MSLAFKTRDIFQEANLKIENVNQLNNKIVELEKRLKELEQPQFIDNNGRYIQITSYPYKIYEKDIILVGLDNHMGGPYVELDQYRKCNKCKQIKNYFAMSFSELDWPKSYICKECSKCSK